MASGWEIAFGELGLYFLISHKIREYYHELKNMDVIAYYWFTMTILTLIWECSFVYNFKNINVLSQDLIRNNTHVWTNDYGIQYLWPWKSAFIFYAEYGAYADREYMTDTNDWSRVIESSHAIFCGIFSFLVLYQKINNRSFTKSTGVSLNKYYIAVGVSMGSQVMNSILYMANYLIQINDRYNINYCSEIFPCHRALSSRPFMYVNVFWTVMPSYTIISSWRDIKQNLSRRKSITSGTKIH